MDRLGPPIAVAAPVPSSVSGFATASCLSSSLLSSVEIGIRFGPVTNGLGISPTGSKGRYIEVLATMPVIASTGAMLVVGHEAPVSFSVLACRIESVSDWQRPKAQGKFLAPATASKTPSMLVGKMLNQLGKHRPARVHPALSSLWSPLPTPPFASLPISNRSRRRNRLSHYKSIAYANFTQFSPDSSAGT
jgi:hypothetical protein